LSTLVTTEELAQHPEWRVFDCRHDLANPALGEQQYQEAHIPGALFASLDRDLSAPKNGGNGRHPLPEARSFLSWMGKQGLKPTDTVVCYDGGPGAMAARLWWMLRWAGHEQVSVLDGGLAKWQREGRPVTIFCADEVTNPPTPMTPSTVSRGGSSSSGTGMPIV